MLSGIYTKGGAGVEELRRDKRENIFHQGSYYRWSNEITHAFDILLRVLKSPPLISAEMLDESHAPATPEEISSLEEFIPTRLTCLTLLQASVTVSMAEFNLLHTLLPVIMGRKVVHKDPAPLFYILETLFLRYIFFPCAILCSLRNSFIINMSRIVVFQ